MLLIDVIHAAQDPDLSQRMIAAAALAGEADPEGWQWRNRYRLAAAPATDGPDDTIASLWDYAAHGKELTQPGLDPTVITDDHIRHAVAHVRGAGA